MKKLVTGLLLICTLFTSAQSKKQLYKTRDSLIMEIGVSTMKYFVYVNQGELATALENIEHSQDNIKAAADVCEKIINKLTKKKQHKERMLNNKLCILLIGWSMNNEQLIEYIEDEMEKADNVESSDT